VDENGATVGAALDRGRWSHADDGAHELEALDVAEQIDTANLRVQIPRPRCVDRLAAFDHLSFVGALAFGPLELLNDGRVLLPNACV
jgi:hypothetical protein